MGRQRSGALDREEVGPQGTKTKSDKCPAPYLAQQLTTDLSNIPGSLDDVRASPPTEAHRRVHVSGAT